MDESELNRLRKKITALALASNDMIEAEVAASWRREIDDPFRSAVVMTGMVIAYGRPFAKRADYKLDRSDYEPHSDRLLELHRSLLWWRDKVYAHTDKAGGRTARITPRGEITVRTIEWERIDFPVARLDDAIELFQGQRACFQDEAERLQRALEALPT